MLGPMLLTRHNLQHYQDLMRRIRDSIAAGSFASSAECARAGMAAGDIAALP